MAKVPPPPDTSRRALFFEDSSRQFRRITDSSRRALFQSSPSQGTCVQEWSGTAWVVVDDSECRPGFVCRPLDPAEVAGEYAGQRVITPAVPADTPRKSV
jgi:hypothetical protein